MRRFSSAMRYTKRLLEGEKRKDLKNIYQNYLQADIKAGKFFSQP